MKENMHKSPDVFFSNKLEILADSLFTAAFPRGSSPFEERLIMVPDKEMKKYLLQRFAKRYGIAAGLHIVGLSEGIQHLLRQEKRKDPYYLPSRLDLSLRLESEIIYLSTETDTMKKYPDLFRYLESTNDKERRKKVISLAGELSCVFSEYGTLGRSFLKTWLEEYGWKQELWKRIFSEGALWTYPQRLLSKEIIIEQKIFLFAFSFLPRIYFDFVCRARSCFYFLSPCEYFWEDLYSDKERVHLQKVLEGKKVKLSVRKQFDFYLKESNSLLANWGKPGREFLKLMAEKEVMMHEQYENKEAASLLCLVQNDILQIQARNEKKALFSKGDSSIQLLSTSSKLREVEVLLESLYSAIDCSLQQDQRLMAKDILVLCPNLEEYVPYIRMVFGAEDCALDYSIEDVDISAPNSTIEAFEHLLSLSESRFSLACFLKLFSYPSFYNKAGWKKEDVYLLSKWFEKASVNWGLDEEHKNAVLASGDSVGKIGTWQHGFEQLLMGLCLSVEEEASGEFITSWPLNIVEWNDAALLGRAMLLIKSLSSDLIRLQEEQSASICQLIQGVEDFVMKYLEVDEVLLHGLKKIKETFTGYESPNFTFASFLRILQDLKSMQNRSLNTSHLQAVKFSSFKVGKVLPAKVIFLMGLQEESFPKMDSFLSLKEMTVKSQDYFPTKIEEARYLFLQALISARERFIISYQRVSSEDHKPQSPSPIVQELFSYLDLYYASEEGGKPSELLSISHPALSFHKSYFMQDAVRKCYSVHHVEAARSYYGTEKKQLPVFLPELYERSSCKKAVEGEVVISVQELGRFAKHPIRFFFQDALGIYLDSLFQKEEKEFVLPAYERATLRGAALYRPLEFLVSKMEMKGKMPVSLFKQIACRKMQEQVISMHKGLEALGIAADSLFSLELNRDCKEPVYKRGQWTVPALEVKGGLATYRLEGVLSGLCEEGMIVYAEDKLRDLVPVWPMYLILACLPLDIFKGRDFILTKQGLRKKVAMEDPFDCLRLYLDYFMQSRVEASPLVPNWSEILLVKEVANFAREMEHKNFLSLTPFPDDYLRWLFLRDAPPDGRAIFEKNRGAWEKMFAPLIEVT